MIKNIRVRAKVYLSFLMINTLCNANQVPIESPVKTIQPANQYEFIPISTMVGLGFIAACFLLLTIAKIINANSDQYMSNNRFDLIIFKPPTKNSVIGRVYSNNNANVHNLAAAASSGFDVSVLDTFRIRSQNTQSLAIVN